MQPFKATHSLYDENDNFVEQVMLVNGRYYSYNAWHKGGKVETIESINRKNWLVKTVNIYSES